MTENSSKSNPVNQSTSSLSSRMNDSTGATTSTMINGERKNSRSTKIGTGLRSIFRRFSRTNKSLTEMEIQILSTRTNFTREEVLEWHKKFIADYPNGYMSRKQFISMYKSLFPKSDAERFARHVFHAFDLDRSNTVDFHEFLSGLSMTSATSSVQTKLEWTFHVFDIDGNGLLTRRECLEVIDAIVRFHQSLQADSTEQLAASARRSMMKIFDNFTDIHSDKLSKSQFVEGCLKDELISRLLAPEADTTST